MDGVVDISLEEAQLLFNLLLCLVSVSFVLGIPLELHLIFFKTCPFNQTSSHDVPYKKIGLRKNSILF